VYYYTLNFFFTENHKINFLFPHHKGTWKTGDMAPLILNFCTRWKCVVWATIEQPYRRGKNLVCRQCGPRSRYGRLREATNIQTLWETQPSFLGSPDRRRVAITTTPSHFQLHYVC